MKNQRMLQITALDADYNSLLGEHLPFTKERLTRHWDSRLVTLYFIYLQIKNQSCGSRRSPPMWESRQTLLQKYNLKSSTFK